MKMDTNTILITGGTSGIGFELATQLLQLGNTVIITGRDQSKLDLAKRKLPNVHTFQCDVSDPKEISDLFEKVTSQFPELNFLINNAGVMRALNLHTKEVDLEDINSEIVINLSGSIRMVKQFLSHLKAKKSAAIMNVSSGLAFVPYPVSPVYCATKAGVHSFTQSLRMQLKDTNIKVFELAPPAVQTPLLEAFDGDEIKGVKPMDAGKMVKYAIKGLEKDRFEILPGQSSLLKFMSRFAPQFMLNQMSKTVGNMLTQSKS
ncbi:SDR family oxidoreductase [Paenibacillus prosopidis]|uniref:Putative oxidoreductase n=1 Tax=Paenibacillus prosopidis TaxID=630520 RepID=A0A368VLM1_9BACL|nr:SDR family NAD(P)-dependent oxidoreductase [Paenibacillus prosopidis]RCW42404.1 putative oxidoreductase [Paenibacillus prosopidis]